MCNALLALLWKIVGICVQNTQAVVSQESTMLKMMAWYLNGVRPIRWPGRINNLYTVEEYISIVASPKHLFAARDITASSHAEPCPFRIDIFSVAGTDGSTKTVPFEEI